ncbi:MAG: DnaD domain protein [Chloroflexota bacterium]
MQGFAGFPDGKNSFTYVPDRFFTELMPIIDAENELRVTIYTFFALSRKEGKIRYLRLVDYLTDRTFMQSLAAKPSEAADLLIDGIERATARGTLLNVTVGTSDGNIDLFFLNTEKGRAAVDGISRGEWRPDLEASEIINILVERPNIFVLYEQNIGQLTPLITDELRDAEKTWPAAWIEEAIQLAVTNNVRKWRYIVGILKRWQQEGKQQDGIDRRHTQEKLRNQIPEEYRDLIQR